MSIDWGYTGIMLVALFTGGVLLRRSQARLPLAGEQKFGLTLGAFCGAMLGAKLPFALADWPGLLDGSAWLAHGKTIMGGLVGGYFGVELAKWLLGVRIKTGDWFAAPVAAAVAMGRLGCFRAGCCFGTPTTLPWGVAFPLAPDGGTVPRHPTQLYEFLFHAAAAGVLFWLSRRGLLRGQLIKLYFITYLVYRFASEWLRPEPRLWTGLTGYQWAAVVLLVLFCWLWVRDRRLLASPEGKACLPEKQPASGDSSHLG